MQRRCVIVWLFLLTVAVNAHGQTPFTASWNFEGNSRAGNSSSGSVSASELGLTNVNQSGFPNGVTGDAVSLSGWPTGGLSGGDYVEFSVTPQGYRFSVTSVTFDCNRSAEGPAQLAIRSNQDNFGSNIGTASIGTGFGNQNYGVSFNDLETEVKFRIYGHTAISSNGTLRLDNLRINGIVTLVPLPVELVLFKTQLLENQVKLTWETAWERNAQSFEVERSSDFRSFATLHTLPAAGDTRERMSYTFTDPRPLAGTNYYRLRQTDRDGAYAYSKTLAVIIENDQPSMWLYENPVVNRQIRLRMLHLDPAQLRLFSASGQELSLKYEEATSAEDFVFKIAPNTPAGLYFLVAEAGVKRVSQKVFIGY